MPPRQLPRPPEKTFGEPKPPGPLTRDAIRAAVGMGRRVCLLTPEGALTPDNDPGFETDLLLCVAANVGGGPWRRVEG